MRLGSALYARHFLRSNRMTRAASGEAEIKNRSIHVIRRHRFEQRLQQLFVKDGDAQTPGEKTFDIDQKYGHPKPKLRNLATGQRCEYSFLKTDSSASLSDLLWIPERSRAVAFGANRASCKGALALRLREVVRSVS